MTELNVSTNNKDILLTVWVDNPDIEYVWEGEFVHPLLREALDYQGTDTARVYFDDLFAGTFSAKKSWIY